ncbi:MAG: hypothetical protein ACYDBB_06995 [Armatimonadota bacterium]
MGNQGLEPTAYLSLILITAGVVWWLLKDRRIFRSIRFPWSSQLPVGQEALPAAKALTRSASLPGGMSPEVMDRELREIKRLLIEINTRLGKLSAVLPSPVTVSDVLPDDDVALTASKATVYQQVMLLSETGMTTAHIAKQLGITRSEVDLLIARHTSR